MSQIGIDVSTTASQSLPLTDRTQLTLPVPLSVPTGGSLKSPPSSPGGSGGGGGAPPLQPLCQLANALSACVLSMRATPALRTWAAQQLVRGSWTRREGSQLPGDGASWSLYHPYKFVRNPVRVVEGLTELELTLGNVFTWISNPTTQLRGTYKRTAAFNVEP